jgi:predicted nucleotidyltransferase
MEIETFHRIIDLVVDYAKSRNDILGIGLCGSWARGEASPDSDIDLSIIVEDKTIFKSQEWVENFHFHKIQDSLKSYRDEIYGVTWSRHVILESEVEIEFGFADKSWANINNLDEGTRKVVSDGYRILYDPSKLLEKLEDKVSKSM